MNAETKITSVFCSQTQILKRIRLFTLTLGPWVCISSLAGCLAYFPKELTCKHSLTDMWIEDRTSFSPKSSLSLVDLAITASFLLEMIFIGSLYFFSPSEAFVPKSFPLAGIVRSCVFGKRTVRGNRPSGLHCSALSQLATGLRQDSELCLYLASFLYNFLFQVIMTSFTFITLTFEEFHYKS